MKTVDDRETLSLRLRTSESTADAAAVASMLNALVVLIDETNDRVGDGRVISIRVRAFEEGSLEIPFDLIVYSGACLLAGNSLISQVLKTIQQSVDLRKSLKGKPPQKPTTPTDMQGSIVTVQGDNAVINITQSPRVVSALNDAFVEIEKDDKIESVLIVDKASREEIVNIQRQEFRYFKYPEDTEDEEFPKERMRGERTTLIVHTPVLVGRGMWKFIYNGATISASMTDESFLERVQHRAERFGAGDRLAVDLEIGEKYDNTTSAYLQTKKFVVRKVIKHSPPPSKSKQQNLFDE